jgi:hypothetical protein
MANSKDLSIDGHYAPFRISAALHALFNSIRHDLLGKSGGTRFSRCAFDGAFDTAGENAAVVASSATANPVLVLDQDYRVEM